MSIVKRHLQLFFHNPSNWIFTILSAFVIISLYFLFIRDFTIIALKEMGIIHQELELFIDLLMMSGLLIVISSTCCLPICAVFVGDKESGIIKDFIISPISKINLYFSYVLAATILSIGMSLVVFGFMLLFLNNLYNFTCSLETITSLLCILILSSMISAIELFTCSLLFHSMTSFSSFGNLFGVIIGFFTGVYIPIGYYPEVIENILFLFPQALTTSLFRHIIADSTLSAISSSVQIKEAIETMFGLSVKINGFTLVRNEQLILLVLVSGGITLILYLYSLRHSY